MIRTAAAPSQISDGGGAVGDLRAVDDLVHDAAVDGGPLEDSALGLGEQVYRVQAGEVAVAFADRGPNGLDDDGVAHGHGSSRMGTVDLGAGRAPGGRKRTVEGARPGPGTARGLWRVGAGVGRRVVVSRDR
ncbi:hypothetical protein [Embleya sp. NBC_00896]|uniref:hypothetical protein n=1 Tax=Embleya sp. NBC_00896 TaxID=2975961 RepID=UPI00386DE408|nr:hypothetical protein OG928_46240 [Embleya sp. NBC_00896]